MSKKTIQDEEAYIAEVVRVMSSNILTAFTFQEKAWGVDHAQKVYCSLIATVIAGVVYKSLADLPDKVKGKKKQYEWAADNYAFTKEILQNSIAAGFKNAMLTYSGVESDYYCQIKMVPEATNKPC